MERKIKKVKPGVFEVPSFTDDSKTYTVDLATKRCTCPADRKGHQAPCKHLLAAIAFEGASMKGLFGDNWEKE